MSATKEQWKYGGGERVWAGTYRNSQNTLHWHSDCEFICVRRGAATVVCDGVTYKPTEGDAMFIDSECLHRINADTNAYFRPQDYQRLCGRARINRARTV